jgi:hypothetical protein
MKNIENISIPVEVEEVKNICKNDFYANKTYVQNVNSERTIYLDTDTIVLGKIDKIYKNKNSKVFAKKVHNYGEKSFSKEEWYKLLDKYSARKGPYFNSGFVIYEDGANESIGKVWKKVYKEIKKNYCDTTKKVASKSKLEQLSLSITLMKEGVRVEEMGEESHIYGWVKRPDEVGDGAIVYHTGSRGDRHLKYASAVARGRDLSFNVPLISSATHPLFLKLQGYDLGYRAKHFFTGVGD